MLYEVKRNLTGETTHAGLAVGRPQAQLSLPVSFFFLSNLSLVESKLSHFPSQHTELFIQNVLLVFPPLSEFYSSRNTPPRAAIRTISNPLQDSTCPHPLVPSPELCGWRASLALGSDFSIGVGACVHSRLYRHATASPSLSLGPDK